MRRFGIHAISWRALLVAGSALLAMTAQALETNAPPAAKHPNASSVSQLRHLSPVEFFRGLLGMNAQERDLALAGRPPADKAILLAKVREYQAMPRDIREARLCQTELHWELSGLMKLPPDRRNDRLNEVSPQYLPMVMALLRQWDQVPADTQKALLENQNFIGVYLRLQGASPAARQDILDNLPAGRRAHWTEELGRWQALPEAERSELCAQFQHFCSLSTPEQQETVETLSADDRRAMEAALGAFDRLPPAQRALCISSFRKFAAMAPGERNQFLKNAARWDAMTRHERQLWRELVLALPPLPPGFTPTPPLPPGFQKWMRTMPPLPPLPPNVTAPVIVARATKNTP
jgi:hypothetical protein